MTNIKSADCVLAAEETQIAYSECRILTSGNLCNISIKQTVDPCKDAANAIEDLNNCGLASHLYCLNDGVLEAKTSVYCKDRPSITDLAKIIAEMLADMKAAILAIEKGDDADGE